MRQHQFHPDLAQFLLSFEFGLLLFPQFPVQVGDLSLKGVDRPGLLGDLTVEGGKQHPVFVTALPAGAKIKDAARSCRRNGGFQPPGRRAVDDKIEQALQNIFHDRSPPSAF